MSAVLCKSAMPSILYVEPLFESTHQALLFAYTFTANQYAVTAAAEREIAKQGGSRYERELPRRPSRGLRGLDGAAQAGMILASVERLNYLDQAFIGARFDVLNEDRRAWWIRVVSLSMRRVAPVGPELADLAVFMVDRHFGAKIVIDDYIEHFGLPRATLYRRASRIRRSILEHADLAMMRIDAQLVERKIVQGP